MDASPPGELAPADGSRDNDAFHIAFGVDASYFRGMCGAIASILENNPGTRFIFHVFLFAISRNQEILLASIRARHGTDIVTHIVDPSIFDGLGHLGNSFHFSTRSALVRLVIPPALHAVAKRVLYIDADVLCTGDVGALALLNLEGVTVAAVHDMGRDPLVDMQCHVLGIPRDQYFNAGFLYVNTDEWMTNDITSLALSEVLLNNDRLIYPDQDVLNLVLKGKTRLLDDKWNFQFDTLAALKRGETRFALPPCSTFIHFVGRLKPWHGWNMHDSRFLLLNYEKHAAWTGTDAPQPTNADEMFAFSQVLFRNRHMLRGVKWYLAYLSHRFAPATRAGRRRWKETKQALRAFQKTNRSKKDVGSPLKRHRRKAIPTDCPSDVPSRIPE